LDLEDEKEVEIIIDAFFKNDIWVLKDLSSIEITDGIKSSVIKTSTCDRKLNSWILSNKDNKVMKIMVGFEIWNRAITMAPIMLSNLNLPECLCDWPGLSLVMGCERKVWNYEKIADAPILVRSFREFPYVDKNEWKDDAEFNHLKVWNVTDIDQPVLLLHSCDLNPMPSRVRKMKDRAHKKVIYQREILKCYHVVFNQSVNLVMVLISNTVILNVVQLETINISITKFVILKINIMLLQLNLDIINNFGREKWVVNGFTDMRIIIVCIKFK